MVHQFTKGIVAAKSELTTEQYPNPPNATHCENCYCYVCDKPAKECKSWAVRPAGERYGFHCDATPDDPTWCAGNAGLGGCMASDCAVALVLPRDHVAATE